MSGMWYEAISFNQSLSEWDVSQVRAMDGMLHGAEAFNQSVLAWDVSRVVTCQSMFSGCGIKGKEHSEFPLWDEEMRTSAWSGRAAVENDGYDSLSDNSGPDDASLATDDSFH
jgi:hypothetical protein